MNTRNSTLTVIVLAIIMGWPSIVFAGSVNVYGGPFDLLIPADSSETKGWMDDAVINVSDHVIICDLDVCITIEHTKVFDLQIRLQSPDGTKIWLNKYNPFTEYFEGANYTQTIFDDQAAVPIEQASPPFTGRFKPKADNFLQVFNGKDAYGSWLLQVNDGYFYDTGKLKNFELLVTIPEPASAVLLTLAAGLMRLRSPRPE